MKKLGTLFALIFFSLSAAAVLAQNTSEPPLTSEEIQSYCRNVQAIVDVSDPVRRAKALGELGMTYERFKYVDLKLNNFAMIQQGFTEWEEAGRGLPADPEEEALMRAHQEEIIKANGALIKLLTFGVKAGQP